MSWRGAPSSHRIERCSLPHRRDVRRRRHCGQQEFAISRYPVAAAARARELHGAVATVGMGSARGAGRPAGQPPRAQGVPCRVRGFLGGLPALSNG
jgi:hypothetical protein